MVGDETSTVAISVSDGEAYGQIDMLGFTYVIQPLENGSGTDLYVVKDIDHVELAKVRDIVWEGKSGQKALQIVTPAANEKASTVKLHVLYTAKVAAERNMSNFVATIISTMNLGLSFKWHYSQHST